jgi:D-alanine-D-alanine ligase
VLETAGIPYIGHTPLNAALLDDKGMFKLACAGLGLPTAPFIVHNPASGSFRPDRSPNFRRTFGSYKGPFIVKPVNGEGGGGLLEVRVPAVNAVGVICTRVSLFILSQNSCHRIVAVAQRRVISL